MRQMRDGCISCINCGESKASAYIDADAHYGKSAREGGETSEAPRPDAAGVATARTVDDAILAARPGHRQFSTRAALVFRTAIRAVEKIDAAYASALAQHQDEMAAEYIKRVLTHFSPESSIKPGGAVSRRLKWLAEDTVCDWIVSMGTALDGATRIDVVRGFSSVVRGLQRTAQRGTSDRLGVLSAVMRLLAVCGSLRGSRRTVTDATAVNVEPALCIFSERLLEEADARAAIDGKTVALGSYDDVAAVSAAFLAAVLDVGAVATTERPDLLNKTLDGEPRILATLGARAAFADPPRFARAHCGMCVIAGNTELTHSIECATRLFNAIASQYHTFVRTVGEILWLPGVVAIADDAGARLSAASKSTAT